ncbi:hypothetical protein F6B93_21335 [Mycobacterium spongiae]|uniref:Proline rich protein n=2 Tax=Mycobacterium spongiae TaxID=886343 RepID=A0A975K241_9MYCO|nr:hypothetical protein [Mycobacterium spongiae]QUR69274.1 hypothetical protein F6B93_21335 [Mycobacterium spongiae]
MNEIPESSIAQTSPAPPPAAPAVHQTPKVFKAAAWVVTVAGIVFIVAVIFFTGFRLGMHSGHDGFRHHRNHKHPAMMLRPGMPHGGAPAMRPGTGPAGPGQLPSAVSPSAAPTP